MGLTLRWVQHLDRSNTWMGPIIGLDQHFDWQRACALLKWSTSGWESKITGWIERCSSNISKFQNLLSNDPSCEVQWKVNSIWQFQHTRIVAWSDNTSVCAHFYNGVSFVKFKKGMYNYCLLKVPVLKLNRGEEGRKGGEERTSRMNIHTMCEIYVLGWHCLCVLYMYIWKEGNELFWRSSSALTFREFRIWPTFWAFHSVLAPRDA